MAQEQGSIGRKVHVVSKSTQKSEKHKIHLNILGEPEAHPNPVRPVAWVKVGQCKDRGRHLQPGNVVFSN